MASLEVGFSHDIFVEWATEAKNLVLFTEKGQVLLIWHHITLVAMTCFFVDIGTFGKQG